MTEVRIGLLGLGTVGAGVAKILESRRAMLEERAGCRLTLAAVADVDLTRPREGLDIKKLPMTPDAARVLADPSVQVIIEHARRSEEHTSELQSRLHLVCRL